MLLRTTFAVTFVIALSLLLAPVAPAADQVLKPYLLGYRGPGTIETKLPEVKAALEQKGFHVVGEYDPARGSHVIVVTSDALKNAAAASSFGAYGAVVRVSLTDTGEELQLASTDPRD